MGIRQGVEDGERGTVIDRNSQVTSQGMGLYCATPDVKDEVPVVGPQERMFNAVSIRICQR